MSKSMLEDLHVGQEVTSEYFADEEAVACFLDATGDSNPIHWDRAYARSTPFGRCIAHGVLGLGFVSAVLGTRLPGEGAVFMGLNAVRFHKPIPVGEDPVYVHAQIESITPKPEKHGGVVTVAFEVLSHGEEATSGNAVLWVASRA